MLWVKNLSYSKYPRIRIQVAEKIANLEKEKRELSEKLELELKNAEKMKKTNNDASVAKVNSSTHYYYL